MEEKLYNLVISNNSLKLSKNIVNKEFNLDDIEEFINSGILIEVDNSYKLVDFDGLYNYREVLIKKKKYPEVKILLMKCFELKPTSTVVILKLIRSYLFKYEQHERELKYYLEYLYLSEDINYQDCNFIVYLLSILGINISEDNSYGLEELTTEDDVFYSIKRSFYDGDIFNALLMLSDIKLEGISKNYGKVINRLMLDINKINREVKDEFKNEDLLNTILNLTDTGLSVEEACDSCQLTYFERSMLYLKIARYYYTLEDDVRGNYFLKKVEKSKKNTVINYEYNELLRSRRFQKNYNKYDSKVVMDERILSRLYYKRIK